MAMESQGTILKIETGAGEVKNITGITLGAITKIQSVAHGLPIGDVVIFDGIGGAAEFNGQKTMITAVETDSFYVGINSIGYTPYTSGGTATSVAYTEIGEVIDWEGPGGSASVIDKTHLASTAKEKMIGLRDEGQFTFSLNAAFGDLGQQAIRASRNARSLKGYKITYSDSTVQSFDGYALEFSTSGGVDDKVNASATIEITGEVATT